MLANKNTSGNPPYKFSNADSNSSLFLGPTKTENYPTKSYIIKSSDISHGKSGGPNPLPLEKPNYPDIDMAISGFPTTGNRNVPGTTTTTRVFVKRDPEICSPEVLQSETKIINPVTGTGASSLTDPLMEDESSIDVSIVYFKKKKLVGRSRLFFGFSKHFLVPLMILVPVLIVKFINYGMNLGKRL